MTYTDEAGTVTMYNLPNTMALTALGRCQNIFAFTVAGSDPNQFGIDVTSFGTGSTTIKYYAVVTKL